MDNPWIFWSVIVGGGWLIGIPIFYSLSGVRLSSETTSEAIAAAACWPLILLLLAVLWLAFYGWPILIMLGVVGFFVAALATGVSP